LHEDVVREAKRPFPIEPVRALEAIHLASALVWSRSVGPIAVASTDERVRTHARALGLDVLPRDP